MRKYFYMAVGVLLLGTLAYRQWGNKKGPMEVDVDRLLSDIKGNNATLQSSAIFSLFYFSRSPEYKEQLVKKEVVLKTSILVVDGELEKQKRPELLSLCILALSNVMENDMEQQAIAVQVGLVEKLFDVVKTGVPPWKVSALRALTVLAKKQDEVRKAVFKDGPKLTLLGLELMQAGAMGNHSDVVAAVSGMLAFLIDSESCRTLALKPPEPLPALPLLAVQVLQSFNTSDMIGPVVELVDAMLEKKAMTPEELADAGVVHLIVAELRRHNKLWLTAVMSVLQRLVLIPAAGQEVVGAGGLSLCLQLFFKPSSPAATRQQCSDMMADLSGVSRQEGAVDAGGASTPLGARHMMSALLRILKDSQDGALQHAALEALRDVATGDFAAEVMVEAGVVPLLSTILNTNITALGKGGEAKSWLIQSQRSAALITALLALKPSCRSLLLEQNMLGAVCAAIVNNAGPGLFAQNRVTATAALVPLLGNQSTVGPLIEQVVLSGALEKLVIMYFSSLEAEQATAIRVLKLLAVDAPVAKMLRESNMTKALPDEAPVEEGAATSTKPLKKLTKRKKPSSDAAESDQSQVPEVDDDVRDEL